MINACSAYSHRSGRAVLVNHCASFAGLDEVTPTSVCT